MCRYNCAKVDADVKKAIEQKQETIIRTAQMKKALRRIDNSLSDQHKHNDYDIDELQDSHLTTRQNRRVSILAKTSIHSIL